MTVLVDDSSVLAKQKNVIFRQLVVAVFPAPFLLASMAAIDAGTIKLEDVQRQIIRRLLVYGSGASCGRPQARLSNSDT